MKGKLEKPQVGELIDARAFDDRSGHLRHKYIDGWKKARDVNIIKFSTRVEYQGVFIPINIVHIRKKLPSK
jgi:hypothetical protein